jgi:hypothetical protein
VSIFSDIIGPIIYFSILISLPCVAGNINGKPHGKRMKGAEIGLELLLPRLG